jgi:hypothetical protein
MASGSRGLPVGTALLGRAPRAASAGVEARAASAWVVRCVLHPLMSKRVLHRLV